MYDITEAPQCKSIRIVNAAKARPAHPHIHHHHYSSHGMGTPLTIIPSDDSPHTIRPTHHVDRHCAFIYLFFVSTLCAARCFAYEDQIPCLSEHRKASGLDDDDDSQFNSKAE